MKFLLTLSFLCFLVAGNCKFLENEYSKIGPDPIVYHRDRVVKVYDDRDGVVEDIELRFYNGDKISQYVNIRLPDAGKLMTTEGFDKSQPTVLYIHGFKENAEKESVHTVVSSYLRGQKDTNIVLVDWSNMAYGSYLIEAAPNTRRVAKAVAKQIKKWLTMGLPLENLHIVGHSLGGQIAGFIGKEMKEVYGTTLKRISALDPAFPMFYPGAVLGHIEEGDADFVDVIHTDAGGYGAPRRTGRVDFWPNRGLRYQPGCPTGIHLPMSDDDLCSHWRSWRFWAESVTNPENFPAKSDKGDIVFMGDRADPSAQGDYRLVTNSKFPFGMGMDGIVDRGH